MATTDAARLGIAHLVVGPMRQNGLAVTNPAHVGKLMTRDVIASSPDTPLRDAARLMARHCIRHLPVLKGSEVVGILSQRDV